jgi:hypothetical protein
MACEELADGLRRAGKPLQLTPNCPAESIAPEINVNFGVRFFVNLGGRIGVAPNLRLGSSLVVLGFGRDGNGSCWALEALVRR